MLKREDDTEKNEKLEKFNSKYNIEELFANITEERDTKNSTNLKKDEKK